MSEVLAIGNPFDGLSLIGPFDDCEAANEYAEQDCNSGDWWVVSLEPPPPEWSADQPSARVFPSLDRVDWPLLHRQKRVLLDMLSELKSKSPRAEALRGLVELLDALQDDAAAAGRWTFPGEPARAGAQPEPD